MKTLEPALLAEHSASVTRPAVLVEIAFSTPLRMSSIGDVTWDSKTWVSASLRVDDMQADGSLRSQARVIIGNTDRVIGALLLNERVSNRRVQIWSAWIDATSTPRVMASFDGYGRKFSVGSGLAVIDAASAHAGRAHAPREMIDGLGIPLRPVGYRFAWDGQTYTFDPAP